MSNSRRLSVVDKLLMAALDLLDDGKNPFSAEDLVVEAWKMFPDTFGLAGHVDENGIRKYPDSNRVFAEIMGSKPIRKKGFLRKVATKMYAVTDTGVQEAKALKMRSEYLAPAGIRPVEKTALGRPIVTKIKRLISSNAVQKYLDQRFDTITFYDACTYWGITPRSSAIQLEGKIAELKSIVNLALKETKGGQMAYHHGGKTFSEKELKVVLQVEEWLEETFKDQLQAIRRRRDERAS